MLIGKGMGRSDRIPIIGFAIAPGAEVLVTHQAGGFKAADILRGYIYVQCAVFRKYAGFGLLGCDDYGFNRLVRLALCDKSTAKKKERQE
ncbi:hypothetical protein GCM10027299_34310 [Larkinella ripae]